MTDDSRDIHAADELRIEATAKGKAGAADVVCRLGEQVIYRDRITPAKADDRKKFGQAVLTVLGGNTPITTAMIEAELMATVERLDAVEDTGTASNTQARPLEGEELDATQVIRPELVLRADVSAIAIPRLMRIEGRNTGEWLHYIRCGDDRRCERLGERLRLGDDTGPWLSPLPAEPTPNDVKELNRWSAPSRQGWLNGDASPTTGETLRMVSERINRYVVLPLGDAMGHGLTLAAWVMMTYAYPMLPALPYLYLAGPPGSGKTRTMDVLSRMVFRPMMTGNVSAPVIFRTRHTFGGVLLLDEAERMRDTRSPDVAELLSILLSGYRRGGRASRMEPCGDSYRSVSFDCFGPVVLGCIKGLPPALASRCITVRMMRASKSDPQIERSLDDTAMDAAAVLDALHCWSLNYAHDAIACPVPPSSLANRDAELWGPLLRIVAHTGDDAALSLLVDHAERMTTAAANDSTPEYDGLILTAYYRLRKSGEVPTAGEVLERAKLIDNESLEDWKPRMVGGILHRYFDSAKSNGRKVFRDEPGAIADIANRYGYDIDGGAS